VSPPVHRVEVIESALTTKSLDLNLQSSYIILRCYFCYVNGIVNLAPESLPVTVKIVFNVFAVPNNVLTVVAVKLIVVPITVLDTFVPTVVVVFN
jgi:hypothetical protein